MFNRIRVVTMLMMVLGVFALLQLVSGGLLFSSLQHNQQGFVISNELRQQQSELTSTWDLMLQTRINLSRSAARMMMDASNQQSSGKTDLLQNAKTTLAQAAAHYANFKNMTPLPAMAEASANVDEKYQRYQAALTELIQFLDNGNMDAYFAQPTQGMQNALGEALGNYARVSENLYRQTFDQSAHDYRFAQWQLGVLAVVLVLILMVVWFGIRHALLNPLARVITHIREIASGDLTKTLTVSGRNEIGELAGTVEHMQRSLIDTVTQAPGRWKVFASDIDTEVLEKARSGIYRLSELKTLSPQQLQRYFMRGTGPHEGLVRVRQELANYVEFSSVNLLEKQYNVPGPFDAIFCRNVMIYFDKTTQEDILRRFVPLLKPDGLLFAGHSENFSNLVREFSLRGQTVYALSKDKA